METTREQKHHHREHRSMMHSANERACASRFFLCYVLKRMSIHISFSHIYIFFCALLARRAPKTKERDLSFSLILTHIRNRSHREFFFDENDKADRKSLQQAMHGVEKKNAQEKEKI
mgnify:CR=1 FL=1